MQFIQEMGHTYICVPGAVNAAEYESYRFCDAMAKHSIMIHHWFGFAYYYHKHFHLRLKSRLYHPNVYSDMTITLDGNTVSFYCDGWQESKTFDDHHNAVEYANRLLDEDMSCKNYRVMAPGQYKRSMRGVTHFDSWDHWGEFRNFSYPYDTQSATTHFPEQCTERVVFERDMCAYKPHLTWIAYIQYNTYIVELIPKETDDVIFDISKTRVIGNYPIPVDQWDRFLDNTVQTFVDEVRWQGYQCEYNEITHELKVVGLSKN